MCRDEENKEFKETNARLNNTPGICGLNKPALYNTTQGHVSVLYSTLCIMVWIIIASLDLHVKD